MAETNQREYPPLSAAQVGRNKVTVPVSISGIILEYVKTNKLMPGDRIPSEKYLSEELGVSSRSIREALKILQARGFLRIEHGKGAYICDEVYTNFLETLETSLQFSADPDTLLLNLIQVRRIIETAMIETVAISRTESDLRRLLDIVNRLEAAAERRDVEEYNRQDVLFHKTIVDAGRNSILMSFYTVLVGLILESDRLTGNLLFSDKSLENSVKDDQSVQCHRAMWEAIRDSDRDEARRLLMGQLNQTESTLRSMVEAKRTKVNSE